MSRIVAFIGRFFDKRIYIFVGLFALLFGFDLLAIKYTLYWQYRWIDIPVHFLGGFFLGALLFYIAFSNKSTKKMISLPRTKKNIFIITVLLVFVAAAMFEVLEFALGRTIISPAFVPDTTLDLIAGTAGGYLFYLLYQSIREMIRFDTE